MIFNDSQEFGIFTYPSRVVMVTSHHVLFLKSGNESGNVLCVNCVAFFKGEMYLFKSGKNVSFLTVCNTTKDKEMYLK